MMDEAGSSANIGSEDRDMDTDSLDNTTTLNGWSKEDKFDLLQALKASRSDDPKIIHDYIPHKTPTAIKEALDFYNEQAQKLKPLAPTVNAKPTNKGILSEPLAEWAKNLTDKNDLSDLITETAYAVRLIAEFEEVPPAAVTENIEFKKIYHIIADALEGKPLPEDKCVSEILNKCIYDTALTSKTFLKSINIKQFLETIKHDVNNDVPLPLKQTINNEIACITHLASQKCYNPLNIPENALKYQN